MKTKKPKHYAASSVRKGRPSQGVKEPQEGYSRLKGRDLDELAASILKLIGEDRQKRATLVGLLVTDVATKQEFTTILEELKAMREESDRKFEASERRFEAIDKRFEAVDKRFEAVEAELKAMREESDRQFEIIEKRFETIDKRFEEQRHDFQLAIKLSADGLYKSLTDKISALGSRWGFMAENAFSNALKEVLSEAGFIVSKWRKRDANAEFFLLPRDAEIDILIRNGKRIAIEVKSAISVGDIEIFARSVRFYEKSESVKIDEKIMVGMHLRKQVDEYAKTLGVRLLSKVEEIIEEEK